MEKENIFENDKFGDKYITKDNRLALYLDNKININNKEHAQLYVNKLGTINYELTGKLYDFYEHPLDIVSKYKEPIDEEKLDELTTKELETTNPTMLLNKVEAFDLGFKIGYKKAKEE